MARTFIMTVLCIFAVYGAVRLVISAAVRLFRCNMPEKIMLHTVLFLKNSQEDAEALIRSLVWEKALYSSLAEDIVAVDLGSTDDTMRILKKLDKEYETVHAMKIGEYTEFVKEQ